MARSSGVWAWAAAAAHAASDDEAASVREMTRQWRLATVLPEALVAAKSLAGTRCEHAWRSQRKANDWPGFLANFREVVALSRQEATHLAEALGVSRYDALMSKYEPGMTGAEVERLFAGLSSWLPGLVQEVLARQATEEVVDRKSVV